jgi:hypothetical protein
LVRPTKSPFSFPKMCRNLQSFLARTIKNLQKIFKKSAKNLQKIFKKFLKILKFRMGLRHRRRKRMKKRMNRLTQQELTKGQIISQARRLPLSSSLTQTKSSWSNVRGTIWKVAVAFWANAMHIRPSSLMLQTSTLAYSNPLLTPKTRWNELMPG